MNKLCILVVDDEEEYVTTMVERLELRGIDADGVLSGDDAIEKVKEKDYNVVVLDFKMPGLSGMQAIQNLYHYRPDIKIFLITGYGTNLDGEKDLQKVVYETLPKPIDIDNLLKKIKDAINQ